MLVIKYGSVERTRQNSFLACFWSTERPYRLRIQREFSDAYAAAAWLMGLGVPSSNVDGMYRNWERRR